MRVRGTEFRVLGPTSIEDYHAHLVRLDCKGRFPGIDDHSIDAHCLDLLATGAILIGAYVDGVMRAAAEIVPDRTARHAEAAITVESGYQNSGFERELTNRVIGEARRYHLSNLRLHEQSAVTSYNIPLFELRAYAGNG